MSSFLDSSSFSENLNIQDLQYRNTILTREKQNLINQVNQAMEISKNYNEVINENTKLKATITKKDERIKELEAQIDFNQQTIADLNKDLSIERTNLHSLQRNIPLKADDEDDALKRQYQNEINTYKKQIEQLKNANQQTDINYKTCLQKCERLFQKASEYFNINVNSIDGLYSALSEPKQNQPVIPKKDVDVHKSEKEIQKLKLQLQDTKYKCKQMKTALLSQKKEIDGYLEKCSRMSESMKNSKERYEREINSYTKINKNLKNEIESLHLQLNQIEYEKAKPQYIIPHIPHEEPNEIPEIKENTNDELYKLQINNLKAELDSIREAQKQFQGTVDMKDLEIDELKRTKEELQMRASADSEIIAEQKRTIASLQAAVTRRQDQQKQAIRSNQKDSNPELIEEIQKLKAQLQNNAQIASEAQLELTRAKSDVLKAKSDNENLKTQVSDLQDTINELRHRAKADSNAPKLSFVEVSSAVFACPSLPQQLQTRINNVASNTALLTETKIQKVLEFVGTYIKNTEADFKAEKEKLDSLYASQSNQFKEFLVDISLAIGDDAVTDLSKPSLSSVINSAQILRRSFDAAKSDAVRYQNAFDAFRAIGCDCPEDAKVFTQQLQTGTERLKTKQENAERCAERLRHTVKELKRENRYLTDQLQEIDAAKPSEDEIESQNKLIFELQSKLREKENQLIASTLHPKTNQIIQPPPVDNSIIDELMKQIDWLVKSKQSLQKQYAALAVALKNAEAQNRAIQCELSTLKSSNEELESRLSDANDRHIAQIERMNKRFESEKTSISEMYNRVVDELRAQCESQRHTIEAITDQLAEAECGLDEALAEAADKGSMVQRLRMDLESANEQAELERRLSAARQSAEIRELEADCSVRVGRAEAAAAADRREVIGSAMAAFRKYADVGAPATVSSYRTLLDKVKRRIEELEKSDASIRRVLGIGENHPIEDAIARIVMSM